MQITIVRAGYADARDFGKVHAEAWKQAYAGVFPQEYIDADSPEKREAEFLAELGRENAECYLAFADGTPAGILKCRREEGSAEITSVYVREGFRGCGVGKALMQAALERAKEKEVRLWVLEGNLPARGFYERQGFLPSGAKRAIERGGLYLQLEYMRFGG